MDVTDLPALPNPHDPATKNTWGDTLNAFDNALKTHLGAAAATTDVAAQYVSRAKNTFVVLGDSIDGQGGGNPLAIDQQKHFHSLGWWCWMNDLLGQRLKFLANMGVTGNTTAMILARVPAVTALAPAWVLLGLGVENDIASGVSVATMYSQALQIIDQLHAAGCRIMIRTATPRTTYTGTMRSDTESINKLIRDLPTVRPDVLVLDLNAAVTDPATGLYLTGYSSDALHPSTRGAAEMGRKAANDVASSGLLPATASILCNSDGDATNLIPRGRMVAGAATATPTGYTDGGTATVVLSNPARTDSVAGNWRRIVVTAGTGYYFRVTSFVSIASVGVSVGDTLEAAVEYQLSALDQAAAVNSQGFTFELEAWSAGAKLDGHQDLYWDTSYPNEPPWSRTGIARTAPLVVPTGTTQFRASVLMYGGGTVDCDRLTVRKVV